MRAILLEASTSFCNSRGTTEAEHFVYLFKIDGTLLYAEGKVNLLEQYPKPTSFASPWLTMVLEESSMCVSCLHKQIPFVTPVSVIVTPDSVDIGLYQRPIFLVVRFDSFIHSFPISSSSSRPGNGLYMIKFTNAALAELVLALQTGLIQLSREWSVFTVTLKLYGKHRCNFIG
jgi:hypothetical protein